MRPELDEEGGTADFYGLKNLSVVAAKAPYTPIVARLLAMSSRWLKASFLFSAVVLTCEGLRVNKRNIPKNLRECRLLEGFLIRIRYEQGISTVHVMSSSHAEIVSNKSQ